jgi:BirA family transcriptional regulator, biotin operon repressor / biotin---[acetyl-CoA-carboxylase] ligase
LTDPAPPEHWPELAFVAALAAHDAVAEVAPSLKSRLAIKWPNDLLLDDAKFGGVLIEGESIDTAAVAVGVGVNCASHPVETDFPATDLAAAGATVTTAALFATLSAKMVGRLAQWNRGEHFATIRADWLARAAGLGRTIRVRQTAEGELVGRFEGIDETGRLILLLPGGRSRRLAAADVMEVRGMSQSAAGEP